MSKRRLAMRQSLSLFEALEDRRLMSVGPLSIPGATVNDTAYDSDAGLLHVVYYDSQAKVLKYQRVGDTTIPSGPPPELPFIIDATEGAGQYLSTALDNGGNLHVAYYDAKNGDLKYARRTADGAWSTSTVDSKNTVGLYTSIAIGPLNRPAISYYSKTGGNLKLARFNGVTWGITNVDTNGDVGRYSSLAQNPTAPTQFGIAYEDTTNGDFKYAEVGGAAVVLTTVDATTTKGGGYTSLDFNGDNPAFSYYDAANANLKFAERAPGGAWSVHTVAANNSQGLYSDLEFTFDTNQPAIVYYNKTSDRVVLAYRTPANVWNFETQLSGGGRNLSAVDGPLLGNNPPELFLAYTDTATGNLVIDTF